MQETLRRETRRHATLRRWRAAAAGAIAAGTLAVATAQPHAPSLESIMSAPYPLELRGSPASGAVAWVYDEQGARNVWVAAPDRSGGYAARRVTAYTGDHGVAITGLAWTGDGGHLAYVLGGDGGGRIAVNPESRPEGVRRGELWVVAESGGTPRRIAEGTAPAPAPDGKRIAYLVDGQPWVAPVDGRTEPVPLWVDRGAVSALNWSPDGTRIAFSSRRAPHAIVGVFDLQAQRIQWMAPGIDSDANPIWSPDGRRLAFLRLPTDPVQAFTADREGHPWEIWVADAATGVGHRAWAADPGVGSRFRALFNSASSLFWTAGDELIFPWEKTGWVRLYAVPADGGAARRLTPGDSEVFAAVLSPDRRQLVYATNQDDIDRRHIWRLSTQGRPEPHPLTRSEGIEDMPTVSADGSVFALRGEARNPLRPVRVADGGMHDLAPGAIPPGFPAEALVEPELVKFEAPDGVTVHGQLFLPPQRTGRGPAIVFFHGGPTNRQAFAAWDSFDTHSNLYAVNQYLALRGFIVLSVNYRGGAGYGFEFRNPADFGAAGAGELQDIVGAAEYLLSRPDVDPERMGVWGGSYGGRMASLAMARAPQYFAAGVDYAGVHNWLTMPRFQPLDAAARALAHDSSAIAHVDTWRTPVLIMQPDADVSVPAIQAAELVAALRARRIPTDVIVIPDETHFLMKRASWVRVGEQVADYLTQRLKP